MPAPWILAGVLSLVACGLVLCSRGVSICRGSPVGQVFVRHAGLVGSAFAAFLAGNLFLALALSARLDRALSPEFVNTDVTLVIRVDSLPERYDDRQRFEARVLVCLSCRPGVVPGKGFPKRIRLSSRDATVAFQDGERWRVTLRLKPPGGFRNRGSFDGARHALATDLDAVGHLRAEPAAVRLSTSRGRWLARYRSAVHERIGAVLPTETAALVTALAIGHRAAISSAWRDTLEATGTSHLLAISGLHVGMVYAWMLLLVRFVGKVLPRRGRVLLGLLPLLAAGVYCALAGWSLSTQRALLMLLVVQLLLSRRRKSDSWCAWSLALVIVTALQPLGVLSFGYALSFGTVALLIILHQGGSQGRVQGHGQKRDRKRGMGAGSFLARIWAGLRTHAWLSVLLLPVTALLFQQAAWLSALANAIAIPLVALLILPLSLIGALLAPLWPSLAALVLRPAGYLLELLFEVLRWILELPAASGTLTVPSFVAFALAMSGTLLLLQPRGLSGRYLALPLMLPVLLFNLSPRDADARLHVLDVGQGTAVLLTMPGYTLLYDTGNRLSADRTLADAVVLPYLHAIGRRRIDTLVVSHPDSDHAAGAAGLRERFPRMRVYAGGELDGVSFDDERVQPCVAGERIPHQAGRFDASMNRHTSGAAPQMAFLHPPAGYRGSENDSSCVLLIWWGATRILLPGDIESRAESALTALLGTFPVDVLLAPHHGSSSSSSPAFVESLVPRHIVYTAGRFNAYGFPHAAVQLRYDRLGTSSWTTGQVGTLVFDFDASGLRVSPSSWWHSHRRFWHGLFEPECQRRFHRYQGVWRLWALAREGYSRCGKSLPPVAG